jgi:hypothetical protein
LLKPARIEGDRGKKISGKLSFSVKRASEAYTRERKKSMRSLSSPEIYSRHYLQFGHPKHNFELK